MSAPRPATILRRAASGLTLLLGLALGAGTAHAASLAFAQPHRDSGLWAVPIVLISGPDEEVASLQFELDTGGLGVDSVAAGSAAQGAGKDVAVGYHDDAVSLLVAGINQEVMENGPVAWIYLTDDGRSARGLIDGLALNEPVLSTPEGEPVDYTEPEEEDEETPEEEEPGTPEKEHDDGTAEQDDDEGAPEDSGGGISGGGAPGGFANPAALGEAEGESEASTVDGTAAARKSKKFRAGREILAYGGVARRAGGMGSAPGRATHVPVPRNGQSGRRTQGTSGNLSPTWPGAAPDRYDSYDGGTPSPYAGIASGMRATMPQRGPGGAYANAPGTPAGNSTAGAAPFAVAAGLLGGGFVVLLVMRKKYLSS
ncbi:MAG: hypothetical protein HYV27_08190 [Candidatus Hydrogenedentes bacterium]|nr:hypothetical protein [Candidatus Hydrogenedentota bacterium]